MHHCISNTADVCDTYRMQPQLQCIAIGQLIN